MYNLHRGKKEEKKKKRVTQKKAPKQGVVHKTTTRNDDEKKQNVDFTHGFGNGFNRVLTLTNAALVRPSRLALTTNR